MWYTLQNWKKIEEGIIWLELLAKVVFGFGKKTDYRQTFQAALYIPFKFVFYWKWGGWGVGWYLFGVPQNKPWQK